MTLDTLIELRDRKPFRPFQITINSGSRYSFRAPEQLGGLTEDKQTLVHFGRREEGEKQLTLIDAPAITEISEI